MVVQVGAVYRAGSLRAQNYSLRSNRLVLPQRLPFTFNTLIRTPTTGPHNNKQAPQLALHNSHPKKDPILELKIPAPQEKKFRKPTISLLESQNPRIPEILESQNPRIPEILESYSRILESRILESQNSQNPRIQSARTQARRPAR